MAKKKNKNGVLESPHAYLIRIPKREDRERAIMALLHVPQSRCGLSDFRYLVTKEHIEALQQAGIPYDDVTESA